MLPWILRPAVVAQWVEHLITNHESHCYYSRHHNNQHNDIQHDDTQHTFSITLNKL
jgi:hypothetical protein